MRTDAEFRSSLKKLLQRYAQPAPKPKAKRGPGRPVKARMPTVPVVLHLYRDQVDWLDQYAGLIAQVADGNAHLSRVEIVRGLLMALAEHSLHRKLAFPSGTKITCERDLQLGVSRLLAQSS